MWTLKTSRGQRLALPNLPVVVGSDRGLVDVVIPHPSIAESHARFAAGADGGLSVTALGDAHFEVGGWKVGEAQLTDGDELVLGKLAFTLVREDDPATPPRSSAAAASTATSRSRAPAPPTSRPARTSAAATSAPPKAAADELSLRGKQPLRSKRPEARAGLAHVDVSQLSGGARALVILGLLVVGAAVAYGVAALVGLG